ncbi:agamous-like MADS-box protein AGL27 isoform X2 [Bidens hawaiensis]|uniref:agamous-like MADS-box protein AGL27 isoform X2 n=1 Tax=Bidens hawaiensis TaxID=980011 RepID=UPI00404AA54C
MGRRKLEMKRIEDKNSRLVTFSKRRTGLVKKARHLSILCDVDVAVIVFSARGKLYEFSSTNSVDGILSRYQKAEERTTNGAGEDYSNRFRTCKELLHTADRLADENNAEELSVNDMTQLEQELDAALVQTRLRKTQLMMEYISTLKEKENKLSEEKEELEKQVCFLHLSTLRIAKTFWLGICLWEFAY